MIETEPTRTASHAPADEGIGGAIKALIDDGQTLLEAEIAYRKAQASYGLGEAKSVGVLLVLGLVFGFFTLLALVVGMLLALSVVIGVWGALAVVGGVLAVLSALSLWLATRRMEQARSVFSRIGEHADKAGKKA